MAEADLAPQNVVEELLIAAYGDPARMSAFYRAAIVAVTLAFPLYTSLSSEISTLGRGLAIALVLLGWLYLVAHILLLGAYFNGYGPARRLHPSKAMSS